MSDVVKRLSEADTARTADEARKAALPKSADEYKLELPADFQLPEGASLNENDPRLPVVREYAHKHGLTQEQFSTLIALDARQKIADHDAMVKAITGENEKLGPNSGARRDAVINWLNANLSPEQAKGLANGALYSADQVSGFEKLMKLAAGQGAGFSATGREAPANDGKIEGYETMTFEQRMNAARQVSAPAAQTGRRA